MFRGLLDEAPGGIRIARALGHLRGQRQRQRQQAGHLPLHTQLARLHQTLLRSDEVPQADPGECQGRLRDEGVLVPVEPFDQRHRALRRVGGLLIPAPLLVHAR